MTKAIIFDCFGVLTTDKWKEFVATLPPEHQEEARYLNHAYGSAELTKSEFLKAIEELTGSQPDYIDDRLDNETTKNQQLIDYIATLKPRYKVGLLSNVASNWIREHFLTAEEQKLFDVMVFSYEEGITKPNPKIFQSMAEKLDVELTNCVLVDDVEEYCDAARQLGAGAITYKNFKQMKTELEDLLKKD